MPAASIKTLRAPPAASLAHTRARHRDRCAVHFFPGVVCQRIITSASLPRCCVGNPRPDPRPSLAAVPGRPIRSLKGPSISGHFPTARPPPPPRPPARHAATPPPPPPISLSALSSPRPPTSSSITTATTPPLRDILVRLVERVAWAVIVVRHSPLLAVSSGPPDLAAFRADTRSPHFALG